MTRKLTFLILALFALISGPGWGQASETVTLSYGWENTDDATLWDITESITKTENQGNTGSFAGKINTNHTYVQFKNKVKVTSFSFAFKRTSNNSNYNVYIETSTDGTNWTTAETYAMGSFSNGSYSTKTKTFDGTTEYYVRFHCYNTTAVRYVDDVTIEYSTSDTPTAELKSLAIFGNPTKTTYETGEEFDPAGLVVTGTYDDESQAEITSGITWNVTPNPLTFGTTSVSVTATVGNVTSEPYVVNGLTVNASTPYSFGFESATSLDWDFTNIESKQTHSDVSGHSGSYFGTTGGKASANMTTKEQVANPGTLTCYVSKQTTNTTSSTWYIQVSTNGSNWTDVANRSATDMEKGEWKEFSADLSSYSNVYVRISYSGSTAYRNIDDVSLSMANPSSVATPTFTPAGSTYYEAQTVTIACETVDATIYYTTDGTNPTAESTEYTDAITVSETKTIKAIAYVEDEASNVATATYTILTPLTSMDGIFDAATEAGSNATDVVVTFNEWTISGVKDDNAYLTDGTKGLIIYESDHGFEVGDILTGTVSCKVQLYQGSAELIALTSESEGLTVTEGGSVSPVIMTIDQITSGVFTGAVITIENVTYNSSDESLSDGTNTIKPYSKLYSDMSFTDGKKYNVTGVYLQYNSTKEIMPRSAEDICPIPATEYDILLNQPMYGGGTISADKERAAAGETVTLTAIPDTHYHFAGWIVYYGLGEEIIVDENNQFIMPASVVTISAFFAEDAMYSAAYYYNGVSVHYSDPMYAGHIGTLYDPTDMTPPAGFSFVGWSTSMASTEPIDETYTISSDIDLYAIFEKASTSRDGSEDSFVKVTEAPEDWSGEYLLVYEGGYNESADFTYEPLAWNGADAHLGYQDVTINDDGNIYENPDNVVTLILAPMDDNYSIKIKGGDNNGSFIGRSTNKNGIDFSDEPQSNTIEISNNSAIITSDGGRTMQFNYTVGENGQRFRYYSAGGQQPVQLYKKSESASGTIGRYTRVYDDAYPATGSLLSVEGPSIIVSGYILDIPTVDNDNPANLIIEDGAQLIQNCEGVKATVLKNITGYTNPNGNDGYYLVANPTATVANDEYDALDGCAQFDLYSFNPTEALEWRNIGSTSQKVTFERNVGYLFASANNTTVNFRGSLLPTDETTEIRLVKAETGEGREFPGFNLIGNPYTCNAYPTDEDGNFMPFYKMNEDGSELELVENVEAIAPCQGFFVEANANGDKVTISTTAPEPASLLSLSVSQNRGNVIDRAIVNFDGRNNLHKFMMNPAHTNISLAKNGEEFAAVSASSTRSELPVNFMAEKNGSYTITVNTKNVDANYLHLIDNLTGMDTDLLSTPSYTFDAKTSDYASRFKLVFGVKNDNEEMSQASSFAYINNGEIVISNEGRATLQVIDVMGRIISSEQINGECRISTNGLTAGVYVLNLNGNVQKIVVR